MTPDPLSSNWTIEEVLKALPDVDRVDELGDMLAFRVAGTHATRTAYVYLYCNDLDTISYDLEDESVDNGEWDHAVNRGTTESLEELRQVVYLWLLGNCG
ncbi:hypothetical protein [Rhodopirellula baltica]|uniref:hypothetical protein n=1 Tax=Rhodopirellula baltica TaxID=265606 RepID=UPI001181C478|nr:hypothetical protein [Rhodopirellula baltica]